MENILIYDVAYKTPYSAQPLHIIFDKAVGYIRTYDRTKYLSLFHSENMKEYSIQLEIFYYVKYQYSYVYSHIYSRHVATYSLW